MGELVFIGLGLDDERGITLRGLDEARAANLVFAEFYTSALPGGSIEAVEKLIDRQIHRLSRKEVEPGQVLLAAAASGTVAFLIPGDPMSATTHVDLRLRASAAKIRTRIVHGVSILTSAARALGLQSYKLGPPTPVPFPYSCLQCVGSWSPGRFPSSRKRLLSRLRAPLRTSEPSRSPKVAPGARRCLRLCTTAGIPPPSLWVGGGPSRRGDSALGRPIVS